MKKIILSLVVLGSAFYSYAETVAQINISKVLPIMRTYIFLKDKQLEKEYIKASKDPSEAFKHMKFSKDGKVSFNQADMMKLGGMDNYKIKTKINKIVLTKLTVFISELDLKYDLIIKSDSDDTVVYSKKEINDITQLVYQRIAKRLYPTKK